MKNGLSFSQIVASFVSTSVGCRYFANKLSPHFDAMSLVAQTPWKASVVQNQSNSLIAFSTRLKTALMIIIIIMNFIEVTTVFYFSARTLIGDTV